MTFERRLKPSVQIDLTPLIDVIFQLVIFFMITSTFSTAPGIKLDLPGSTTAQTVSVKELHVVAVSADEIYVNRERTNLQGLNALIEKNAAGKEKEKLVGVLEADKKCEYQLIVSALDAFRRNGMENVSLVTQGDKERP
jgi:biopolymer transport protein ExbD